MTIPKEVYEDRKEQFTKRINAMIEYANETTTCRSRVLLQYFGENHADDCQRCDICIENNSIPNTESKIKPIKEQILELLADGKSHQIDEIEKMPIPLEKIGIAVQNLVDEEVVTKQYDEIRLKE